MNFLFINSEELEALMELPYIQRVVYLMGIRPYMDRGTFAHIWTEELVLLG